MRTTMATTREGFTLIELLIVVVILGMLAAMAVQKFGTTRQAAYYTTLKSDLKELAVAQEQYYQTTGTFGYTSSVTDLEFKTSRGVTVSLTLLPNAQAWSATGLHAGLGTGEGCVIAFGEGLSSYPSLSGGSGAAVTQDTEGAPICTD